MIKVLGEDGLLCNTLSSRGKMKRQGDEEQMLESERSRKQD